MLNSRYLILWALLSLFAFDSLAKADHLLDEGLERLAQGIKEYLEDGRLPKEVIVGDFSGTPKLKSSGGIEIRRALPAKLQKVGIRVADDAELQIMGRFRVATDKALEADDFESLALTIDATLLDGDDDDLQHFSVNVFGSAALHIAGQTVDVSPSLPEKQRQEHLIHQYKNAPTKIEHNRTRPSSKSPFAMEIFVKNGNRLAPRLPRLDSRNRAQVELFLGEEYVVRLHNHARFEAAVTLTIDGVDMFIDAEDAPKDSRLVIFPGSHIDVPGWYINRKKSKEFQIGGYEQSVARRVGGKTSVGVISAAFRACWAPGGAGPTDEPRGTAKGGTATKQGRDIRKDYVHLARQFGAVRSVISVRYAR